MIKEAGRERFGIVKRTGDIYPKWLSISSVNDGQGKITRYIGLFSDISVIKETEEKLYHMANFDVLTGLVNRRYLLDQLERNLQQAKRSNEPLAIMFIDLDGFKLINDSLGHQTGDYVLSVVSERLKECVRDADVVARMGGDEFIILFPQIKNSQNIVQIAEKILTQIIKPISMINGDNFISASIGIAIFPNDASGSEELVQNADTALYRAKDKGKNTYQFFSPEMNRYAIERFSFQSKLHTALDKNEFLVYYQPQYDTIEKQLIRIEALARWKQGGKTFIEPEDFIPIAEETGLINVIGEFIMRTVCEQGKKWLNEGLLNFPISINISSNQLHRPDFINNFHSILEKTGFPPNYLEVELTESIFIENVKDIQDKFKQLKSMGCYLAIDDFGVKYSSLSYLKILPLDKFKIDKSFMKDIPGDSKGADIVKAIIAMGHSLNVEIIAEGVETEEQVNFLKENGCTQIQGYYFSYPVSADDLQTILQTYRHL